MKRSILHVDINNCYATIECIYNPLLKGKALVVGGDTDARHGIVLAKSNEAKACGIKTAMTIGEAKALCPGLLVVPPHYDLYLKTSRQARKLFYEYTDQIEPYGLDEAWLDVTGSGYLFGSGAKIADQIRERVKKELEITVSVGVADNKIFAKLGSDMKKPDAVTTITRDNFRQVVWPQPVGELFYVGRSTQAKLNARNVYTIGQLAKVPVSDLCSWFGKAGSALHMFANGQDQSPVMKTGDESAIKSIGNSTTTARDMKNEQDCRIVFYMLAESVAERLREQGLAGRTVSISLRDNNLLWFERQTKLPALSNISSELVEAAMTLLRENYDFKTQRPLRSIGVRVSDLASAFSHEQLSMFDDSTKREKKLSLETTIDDIRRKYGHSAIKRAVTVMDKTLTYIDPADGQIVHPTGFDK